MNEIVKNGLILFAITIIAGGLLGVTYSVTEEPIAKQQIIQRDKALQNVISDAAFTEMTDLDFTGYDMIDSVFEAKIDGEVAGYAFKLISPEGYGGDMQLVAGITIDSKVSGVDIISHAETPGLGAKSDEDFFKERFEGKEAKNLEVVKSNPNEDQIEAISGATISSNAVTIAVNEASEYYNDKLKGDE